MTPQEAREASRALRGSPLRVEVRALDGDDDDEDSLRRQRDPYAVTETNYSLFRVQPIAQNRYGSFLVVPRETVSRAYDRYKRGDHYDPRATHEMVLRVDRFGTPLTTAAVNYGRREPNDPSLPDEFYDEQKPTEFVLSEQRVRHYLELDDAPTLPEQRPIARRLAVPIQSRSFELLGRSTAKDHDDRVSIEELRPLVEGTAFVLHDGVPTASVPKRLLSWARNYYYTAHEGISADDPLPPIYAMTGFAVAFRSFAAAMSKSEAIAELADASGTTTGVSTADLERLLEGESGVSLGAGYFGQVDGVADHWWVPSGRVLPAADDFFLPKRGLDPMYKNPAGGPAFISEYSTDFDGFSLFPTRSSDSILPPPANRSRRRYGREWNRWRQLTRSARESCSR